MNKFNIITILFVVVFINAYGQNNFLPSYKVFGKGEPLLVINGGPGISSSGMETLAQGISKKGYQVIIFDQRGTGKSKLKEKSSTTINIDLMINDIEELRKYLRIQKWNILGHSFGGLLATMYYEKYSENVNKLIFVSSAGLNMDFTKYLNLRIRQNLSSAQRDSLDFFQTKVDNGEGTTVNRKKRSFYLAHAYLYKTNAINVVAKRILSIDYKVNSIVLQDLFDRKINYGKKFINSTTPVLILNGDHDIISNDTAIEIKNAFGNSTLIILNDCSHYGWLDNPNEFYSILFKFL